VLSTTDEIGVDAVRFRQAIEQEEFESATALYEGPFLSGIHLVDTTGFESWVDHQREALSHLHRSARSKVVSRHHAQGNLAQALEATREWVEHDALDEEAQHLLIRLLAEAGRRTDAIRQFERYKEQLAGALEMDPSEDTQDLARRIRSGEFGAPPSDSGGQERIGDSEAGPRVPDCSWTEADVAAELGPEMEIVRRVGRGTMASVFLARDVALHRLVAIKVLEPEVARDPTARLRFEREARSAARITHPHVCTIHAVGALSSGAPYIVMEYVRGRTLAEHSAARGTLDVDDVRRTLTQVASGLAAAHERQVVHRDVRPSSVLIEDPSGRAVLTDFGIAAMLTTGDDSAQRLTKSGEILGDPLYMSPEQVSGAPVTEEADIFSLGMMAYSLLSSTGKSDPLAIARLRVRGTPISEVRADVDELFEDLIERCLSERPEHRPTAKEVAGELAEPPPRREVPILVPEREPEPGLVKSLIERRIPPTWMAYVGAGWLMYEVLDELHANGALPGLVTEVYLALLPIGFLVATVIAWFHGKRGPQKMPRQEVWILSGLTLIGLVVSAWVIMGP
jgi:serine/threonine protein kinase